MMTKNECDKFMQFLIDKNKNARELSCKLINDNKELIKMLIASINTLKQKKSKA